MKKNKLLNTRELSELIGMTTQSIHTIRWRIKRGTTSPDALPQPINRPGQLRWSLEAYEQWVAGSEPALTPRQVHQTLQDNWKKIRAALQAKGIKTKGLTTTEPNQVGLPHFNLLLFFKTQKQMDNAVLILQKHFGGDRDSKHQLQINTNIDNPLRWAYYITKNIRKEKETEVIDPRIKVWHETWGIRLYNFFGQQPIQHFRDLQNLSQERLNQADTAHQLSPVFIKLWQSASSQPFAGTKSLKHIYSYRTFLKLTETDHIADLATSSVLPTIRFEKLPLYSTGHYALKIIDRSKPQLHIRLHRVRSILSKTIKDGLSGKDIKKNYVKYTVQLYVIIPRSRGSPPRAKNSYKLYR